MKMDPDAENQTLMFDLDGQVPDKLLSRCRDGHKAGRKLLMEKPDFSSFKPAKGAKAAKSSKKSSGGKKSRVS